MIYNLLRKYNLIPAKGFMIRLKTWVLLGSRVKVHLWSGKQKGIGA